MLSARSVLFTTKTAFFPFIAARIVSSSDVKGWVPSKTTRISSALSKKARLRSTPSFSTKSLVSWMPAVSASSTGTPPMTSCSSITSRVVPSYSDTSALSSFNSVFSRLDLPTLGRPIIAVRSPSFKILPVWAPSNRTDTSSAASDMEFFTSL